MTSVDAVFANGVFKPLGPVAIPEYQLVRLTISVIASAEIGAWLDAVKSFQDGLIQRYGVLPDSTPEISASRHSK